MSTTFNSYAFVVTVTLIKANKELMMIKHPTEQNHTHHTWPEKAAGVLRHFTSYVIFSMAKS